MELPPGGGFGGGVSNGVRRSTPEAEAAGKAVWLGSRASLCAVPGAYWETGTALVFVC